MPENKIFKFKDHNILPGPLILGRMELINHINQLCDDLPSLHLIDCEVESESSLKSVLENKK